MFDDEKVIKARTPFQRSKRYNERNISTRSKKEKGKGLVKGVGYKLCYKKPKMVGRVVFERREDVTKTRSLEMCWKDVKKKNKATTERETQTDELNDD